MNYTKAAATALYDLDVSVVTHVPGYGATHTFNDVKEVFNKNFSVSFNEECAYTIAHSAAMCGKRSVCLIKAHGLTKAMNTVTDSLYTDLRAGFVTLIYEDRTGSHSDNILDIIPLIEACRIPTVKAGENDIYDKIVEGYKLSEELKLPVVVLSDAAFRENEVEFKGIEKQNINNGFVLDITTQAVHPYFADWQYNRMLAKTGGVPVDTNKPFIPTIPGDIRENYLDTVTMYMPFFNVYKKYKGDVVCGDTTISSSFILPPYNAIDIVTYMGGSIPLGIGALEAGCKNVWSLGGDFGFISAGVLGLTEAIHRKVPLKVVLFKNRVAAATGKQEVDPELFELLLTPFREFVVRVNNPHDEAEVEEKLKLVANSAKMQILVLEY